MIKNILICVFSLWASTVFAQQDPVIHTPMTPQVVMEGLKTEAKAIGTIAYQWGYPLVRMEQVIRQYTTVSESERKSSYRAPVNKIGWAKELPSPDDTDMPTANNDTYYMSSVVVLNAPYIVTVPDTDDRYYVIDVFDMYHNLTDYIGRRTTGTAPGKFLIVPPGWKGVIPADIKKVIYPKTDKVWLWGRIAVTEDENPDIVHELQDKFTLSILDGSAAELPKWEQFEGELAFFHNLAQAMRYNQIPVTEQALVAMFEKIGIKDGIFSPEKLHPLQLEGLKEAIRDAPLSIIANLATAGTSHNGWTWISNLDNFGYNYGLRALVSGPYLGGQGAREAMYPVRYTDSENQTLNGHNSYTLKFTSMPEVDAFWSVTVYDAKTKMLVENPINRYKIGSSTPKIHYNREGSLDIVLNHKKPAGKKTNWLPIPENDFYLIFRLYQPKENVLNGTYQLPQVYLIE